MRNQFRLLCLVWGILCLGNSGFGAYELVFSTYFGGSDIEHARDIVSDTEGNIYIAGGTASVDFPVTPGGFDTSRDGGGSTPGTDDFDAFVVKLDSNGSVIWATYLGGPNYDRIYAIEVDAAGYVYVAGRAGEGFPTTPGSFQPDFNGSHEGNAYGSQNGFVAKFSPDGNLEWASYAGVGWLCRDIAVDVDGDIYVNIPFPDDGHLPPNAWFQNAFQPNVAQGQDNGLLKISNDGSAVLWATWIGGSGEDHGQSTVRVDAQKNVYINFMTESPDMPLTPGAFDSTLDGGQDGYVGKFSPDGSQLLLGTYVGGNGLEYMETHGLAVDAVGNIYSIFATSSTDFPTTAGVLDRDLTGTLDVGIVKISPTGELLLGTYIGGGGGEGPDGIYLDQSGNIIVGGETDSPDFPLSAGAFDSTLEGGRDGFFLNLSPDFSILNYSSYFGSAAEANVRGLFAGNGGNIYLTGSTNGSGLPVLNAEQNMYGGGSGGCCAIGDAFVARFSDPHVTPISTRSTRLPLPFPFVQLPSSGPFLTFRAEPRGENNMALDLYSVAGIKYGITLKDKQAGIWQSDPVSKGVYLLSAEIGPYKLTKSFVYAP